MRQAAHERGDGAASAARIRPGFVRGLGEAADGAAAARRCAGIGFALVQKHAEDGQSRAMQDRRLIILAHAEARRRAVQAVQDAPKGWRVDLSPPKRSGDQNAKFHAMCSDLARARVQWAGKPRTLAEWKVLLVSGHAMATKEGSEMVPGLEGEFVNLRESTASMTKARGSSLIEYTAAFMAAHGMEL